MANIIKIPRVIAHIKLSGERTEMCKAFLPWFYMIPFLKLKRTTTRNVRIM